MLQFGCKDVHGYTFPQIDFCLINNRHRIYGNLKYNLWVRNSGGSVQEFPGASQHDGLQYRRACQLRDTLVYSFSYFGKRSNDR